MQIFNYGEQVRMIILCSAGLYYLVVRPIWREYLKVKRLKYMIEQSIECPECQGINYIRDGGDGSLCQNNWHRKGVR